MIAQYRVDERVIHGQTTTRLTKEFNCDGLIIVDDNISQDQFMLQLFRNTVPKEIRVIPFNIEKALLKLPEARDSKKSYIVIFKKPYAVRKLIEQGYQFDKTLYIGPQNLKNGGTRIVKMIGLDDNEIDDLDFIEESGVKVILNPMFSTPDLTWSKAKEKIK